MRLVGLRIIRIVSALTLLLAPSPQLVRAGGAGAGGRIADAAMERQLFDEVNAERIAHGLPQLVLDPRLTDVARQRNQYMLDQGVFSHCLDGALTCTVDQLALPLALRAAGLSTSEAAENLAIDSDQGQRTADEIVAMWLGSDEHRPSLLNADFNATGLGVVCCGDVAAYGRTISHVIVVTQVFETYPPDTIASLAGSSAVPPGDAVCRFVLGFKMLHDLDPSDVGPCTESEEHDPATGDAMQHTSNGILVWRKADDRLAFTNGYWTWVYGPHGLARRRNDERFAWEPDPQGLPVVPPGGAAP